MASMMMPEKKVFRARVLDPTKRLPIRFREKCRTKSPKIKRAVAVPPSGMEKEEEMESHLQQAIYAQKATSAGVVVENHVIPTPKVSSLDQDLYEQIYRDRSGRSKKLIVFRDFVSFFLNQSVYDADSEDEEWLNTKLNIPIDQFEQIIFKLELASQFDIIQPSDAKALLQKFNSQIIDDVYDYWLQKRKQVASNLHKYSVLMPRLNTESRREEKTINPYVAFRRRLDKVQTRKKQKTEIQTYEKILRLNYAMKRSILLVEMMKQREKSKLALVGLHEAIFEHQCLLIDSENCELDRLSAEVSSELSANKFNVPEVPYKKRMTVSAAQQLENGKYLNALMLVNKNKYFQRRKIKPEKKRVADLTSVYNDENIVDESWLKWNEELWNRITPTTATNMGVKATIATANIANSLTSTTSLETMSLIGKYDVNSSVDGCYMFTRKFGCQYRAPTTMTLDSERYNINANLSQRQHQQKSIICDEDMLCKVIDGEPKFIAVEIPPLKEFDNEYTDFWPVLRHSSGLLTADNLETKQFRKDGSTGLDGDKNNFVTPSNIQRAGSFGFIRRRMGRGGRVLYDLKF